MKLFYIPNFPSLRIEKSGTIYDVSNGLTCIRPVESRDKLPFSSLVDGTFAQLTLRDIISAFYGQFPKAPLYQAYDCSYRAKEIGYKVPDEIIVHDTELIIWDTVFRQITDYPTYFISEYGVVFNTATRQFLKYSMAKAYITIGLYKDHHIADLYIHRLVYQAYIGELRQVNEYGKRVVIDHKDDCRWNNHYSNLQELTYGANTLKSRTTISDSFNLKVRTWDDELLHFICQQMESGLSVSQIADLLGVTGEKDRHAIISLTYRLRSGKHYTSIASQYDLNTYDAELLRIKSLQKYSEPVYHAIDYLTNVLHLSVREIADILHLSVKMVASHRNAYCNLEGSTTIETVPCEETYKGVTE